MIDKSTKVRHVLRARQTRKHTCHWPGCTRQVPPAKWGCREHWFRLPAALREKVWMAYRIGQEADMRPSRAYVAVAHEVQDWIREQGMRRLREAGLLAPDDDPA